jgi:hypothetical protein
VSEYDLKADAVQTTREFAGELVSFGLYSVTPWNPQGTCWHSILRGRGMLAIHYRDGRQLLLPSIPDALLHWMSARDDQIYALDSAGRVHAVSRAGSDVIGAIGRYDKGHVSAYGDWLFLFDPQTGSLTRFDLHDGGLDARAIQLRDLSSIGAVDRIRAMSADDVCIISHREWQGRRTRVYVSRLRFPAPELRVLWHTSFSEAVDEFTGSPSDLVSCSGDSTVTWVVWTDEALEHTLVKRIAASGSR